MALPKSREEDDDFFGNQHDDDHATGTTNNSQSLSSSDENRANPQQGGEASARTRELSPSVGGGLSRHENRAAQENFRNIGYLESYDASKDVRLQEGFEVGYRETVEGAMRIGRLLGEITTRKAVSSLLKPPEEVGESSDDAASFRRRREEKADEAAVVVRNFLDRQQMLDGGASGDDSGDGVDMDAVESRLVGILREDDL